MTPPSPYKITLHKINGDTVRVLEFSFSGMYKNNTIKVTDIVKNKNESTNFAIQSSHFLTPIININSFVKIIKFIIYPR